MPQAVGQWHPHQRFNGAGVLRPRKCALRRELRRLPRRLQWGRGLKTPEIRRKILTARSRPRLQWGRGLKTPEIRHSPPHQRKDSSFNGAGVLRPRKWRAVTGKKPVGQWLQWGRGLKTPEIGRACACGRDGVGFNGAGVLRPRKSRACGDTAAALSRFNGAGVLRPRKSHSGMLGRRMSFASMGPGS